MGKNKKNIPDKATDKERSKTFSLNSQNNGSKTKYPVNKAQFPENAKISWRFADMEKQGYAECSFNLLHQYEKKLFRFENMTREQIDKQRHCHPCKRSKLTRQAKEIINKSNLDEETLYQIDLGTPCRLWGRWEDSVFIILWLDKDHKFYKCDQ